MLFRLGRKILSMGTVLHVHMDGDAGPKGLMVAEMGGGRVVLLARNFGPPLSLLPGRMKSFLLPYSSKKAEKMTSLLT